MGLLDRLICPQYCLRIHTLEAVRRQIDELIKCKQEYFKPLTRIFGRSSQFLVYYFREILLKRKAYTYKVDLGNKILIVVGHQVEQGPVVLHIKISFAPS